MKYKLKKETFGLPAGTIAEKTRHGYILRWPFPDDKGGWVGVPCWVVHDPEFFDKIENWEDEFREYMKNRIPECTQVIWGKPFPVQQVIWGKPFPVQSEAKIMQSAIDFFRERGLK